MFPFVYNKGAGYYDLYDYYDYDYDYYNHNDDNDDNDNLMPQISLKKIDSRICSICLEGSLLDIFYNYDIDTIIHQCKCQPSIHIICFYQCLKTKKKCVICGTSIIQMLTNREKYIIHLKKCAYYTFLYLLRFSLVTSLLFTTYTVLNSIFMYNYMYNYNYIANEEL